MATIHITISTDSTAFEYDPGLELARILHQTAERYETEGIGLECGLSDINGNRVGSVVCYVSNEAPPLVITPRASS